MAFRTTLPLALAIALPWIYCATEEWLSFPRDGDSSSQSEDSSVNFINYDSDVDDNSYYMRDQTAVHLPKFSNIGNPYVRADSPQLPDKNDRSRVPVIESTGCKIPHELQLPCGFKDCPASVCEMMGCCVRQAVDGDDEATSACYYPMDECTADRQFVFAIVNDDASVPLDFDTLVVPGHPKCVPAMVTELAAVYKFSVNDCGTRSFKIGETEVFLAEVQTKLRVYNLNFGTISRDNPLRFIVECRYPKSGLVLESVGFMVMTPSLDLPSTQLTAEGRFGVELRIAEDETYSSFFPHDHQPLTLLLGKPVYLELRIKAPEARAVILVNYCLAYPRSAEKAMVLIHEGCTNPYDPTINILQSVDLSNNRHTRRFVVHAFQFMDKKTRRYLNEEIYFMCSTELCMPDEGVCEESCFDGLSAS